jgi:hypothetical protein
MSFVIQDVESKLGEVVDELFYKLEVCARIRDKDP